MESTSPFTFGVLVKGRNIVMDVMDGAVKKTWKRGSSLILGIVLGDDHTCSSFCQRGALYHASPCPPPTQFKHNQQIVKAAVG